MVLQGHIQIKRIRAIMEADANESTSACNMQKKNGQKQYYLYSLTPKMKLKAQLYIALMLGMIWCH